MAGEPVASGAFLIVGLGIVVFLSVFGLVVGLFLAVRKHRELKHIERMRAIDQGMLPTDGPPAHKVQAEMVTSIATGVPAITFSLAFVGSFLGSSGAFAWPAAAGTSAVAIICATVLACVRQRTQVPLNSYPMNGNKAGVDADAYDVVGARGSYSGGRS